MEPSRHLKPRFCIEWRKNNNNKQTCVCQCKALAAAAFCTAERIRRACDVGWRFLLQLCGKLIVVGYKLCYTPSPLLGGRLLLWRSGLSRARQCREKNLCTAPGSCVLFPGFLVPAEEHTRPAEPLGCLTSVLQEQSCPCMLAGQGTGKRWPERQRDLTNVPQQTEQEKNAILHLEPPPALPEEKWDKVSEAPLKKGRRHILSEPGTLDMCSGKLYRTLFTSRHQ